jgi:type I restriction enzyme S subunit
MASTTTRASLNNSMLESLAILAPNKIEQKAIASVLSSLDDKIDLLHRQNKTLEQMAETLFRQWFVEEAKEDWEKGCLRDVAENIKKSIKHDALEKRTKYIALEHISKRNISLNSFNNADNVRSNKYKFKVNDILFGKLRPYFHKVCFTSFEGVCSTDILVIRPKQKSLFAYCLFAFFQKDVVDFANSGSEGTRMPRTNWNILSNYPILIPPNELILKFDKIAVPAVSKINNNQKQIRTLEKLRDTLLPKLMSGEIRVKI